MHMRAQGSLEYLVMLAVVLTVALVSVALLGFFPGLTPDARLKQSEAYWKGTEPFAVVETHAWTDGRLTLVVANRRAEGLVLNDVDICVLQACTSYLASPVYFSPGQQQQVTLQGPPLPNLASATGICERRIEFGYSSSNLPALRQIGERDLVLRCPESLSGPPPPVCSGEDEACNTDSDCCPALNLYCSTPEYECYPKKGLGQGCGSHHECLSGICYGSPLRCVAPGDYCSLNDPCFVDNDCCEGYCVPGNPGFCECMDPGEGVCDSNEDCCSGSCNIGTGLCQ